jgi:hypothetical protein
MNAEPLSAAILVTLAAFAVDAWAQNPHPGSAPVNIVNPLPLPVTGDVNVTGSVRLAQHEPFQAATISMGVLNGVASANVVVVPAGKRLVIEGASALVVASTADGVMTAAIAIAGTNLYNRLICHRTGATPNNLNYFFSCDTNVKLYAEAGQTVVLVAQTAVSANSGSLTGFASGYFVATQ